MDDVAERNWAGNYTYGAERIERPGSLAELRTIVADSDRVRALGTGHTFNPLPDTAGTLVRLDGLPADIEVDSDARQVAVGGGVRYGDLAEALHRSGWALHNLASLPHISVAGAVATGTHGSGDRHGSLATAVAALEVVGPDGEVRAVRRGDADFDGSVVALGALGIVSRVVLDVQPTYSMRSRQYLRLGWDAVEEHLHEVLAAADSVSLFTRWRDGIDQVWLKSRDAELPGELFGASAATETRHMLEDADAEAVTDQLGVPGPWHERLPHFRLAFTPSRGEELQSEYFLPRETALDAIRALRPLAPRLAPLLQISEIRSVAADDLWLSGCYGRDTVGVHFTWVLDQDGVAEALRLVEDVLVELGARPHWGKVFTMPVAELGSCYERLADFAALRARVDPAGTFSNPMVDTLLRSVDG